MLRTRVMPCLLLKGTGLVKTVRFQKPDYVGDPVNIVRIFNELEVDELVLLDIEASARGSSVNFDMVEAVASECFMPLTYGGGITSVEDFSRIYSLGVEKCVLNTGCHEQPGLITEAAGRFGSQSIVASIDVRKTMFNSYKVFSHGGSRKRNVNPVEWARRVEAAGAGEILLTSMDRDGTFKGYDVPLVKAVSDAVRIPVIANGGAASVDDFRQAVFEGGASAVAAGSMVVYQGANRAVLTNFPAREDLKRALGNDG